MAQEYWFCLVHQRVEVGPGCPNRERLGPYVTEAEAAGALERAAARNEEWDNDPAWNDDGED